MWYFIGSIILFILGLYLIIKKQYPKFVTKNKVGLLILLLGGLLLTHIYLLETQDLILDILVHQIYQGQH